jgi:hypothetical protein
MGGSSLKPNQTSSVLGFHFLGSKSPADPEHVAIRMAKVHPAGVPRHIGGRKCDVQPGGHALLVHLVHADRHPDALVALFVSVLLKRGGVRAAASASLRPLTKKDASFLSRSNRAKGRRRSAVSQFVPSPLFKPRDRAGDVGHVQYRGCYDDRRPDRGLRPATASHFLAGLGSIDFSKKTVYETVTFPSPLGIM